MKSKIEAQIRVYRSSKKKDMVSVSGEKNSLRVVKCELDHAG